MATDDDCGRLRKKDEQHEIQTLIETDKFSEEMLNILRLAKVDLSLLSSLGGDLASTTLASIVKLDLFDAGLKSLPSCLPHAVPNLKVLFCMKNRFAEMPAVIGACPQLSMVSFKSQRDGGLRRIHPEALQKQMRWLILTDNALECIPSTVGRCANLQKLMLSGNSLVDLPVPELTQNCLKLELIRLASNRLQTYPTELLRGLPALAWVALSDNPFLLSEEDKSSVSSLSLDALAPNPLEVRAAAIISSRLPIVEVQYVEDEDSVLGRGASGTTRRAVLKSKTTGGKDIPVAIKTYDTASTMTSDGLPALERTAAAVASTLKSPHLIRVRGTAASGSSANGNTSTSLVMDLLDPNYRALGRPPSLESCTRDVYGDDAPEVGPLEARSYVKSLLPLMARLHGGLDLALEASSDPAVSVGLCHGDFYAHNLLVDGPKIMLTDFGAATLYNRSTEYGKLLERTEVRAFGHFVDELQTLMERGREASGDSGAYLVTDRLLREISRACMTETCFQNVWDSFQSQLMENK